MALRFILFVHVKALEHRPELERDSLLLGQCFGLLILFHFQIGEEWEES